MDDVHVYLFLQEHFPGIDSLCEITAAGDRRIALFLDGRETWLPPIWRHHYENLYEAELANIVFIDEISHFMFGVIECVNMVPPPLLDFAVCPGCYEFLTNIPEEMLVHQLNGCDDDDEEDIDDEEVDANGYL
jgi:hypothetical protein